MRIDPHERNDVKAWHDLALWLSKEFMNHRERDTVMHLLKGMIEKRWNYSTVELGTLCNQLVAVLDYLICQSALTHTDVKSGLRLVVRLCEIELQPPERKPVTFAQAAAEVDELPF